MSELTDLTAAIDALEAQRQTLGGDATEAALRALRERVAMLHQMSEPAAGERKQITIMFADLSGFTALAESTDAEFARNLVNVCFERIGQVVLRYGGYIDKFIGDEIMVLFGAPVAMEDHAARALYAALEVREMFTGFSQEHRQLREHPLSLHFGINGGLVIAGAIGTEAKRQYTVIGDPVNVAARLVGQAQKGEILIGATTRRLVGERFLFDGLGLTEFKGRVEAQQVYRLRSAREGASRMRGISLSTRMIGRAAELAVMEDAFEGVVAGRHPRSVAVIGPAGIGKSRITQEFRLWLARRHPEAAVLHGAAYPHMAATPYFLIAELLRNWLGVKENDSAGDIRRRLEGSLSELLISEEHLKHALAAIMAVEYHDDTLRELAPEQRRTRIFSAFAAFIEKTAGRSPVLLQLEDLHWSDDLSVDLLEYLFQSLTDLPIMFLNVTRPITDRDSKVLQIEARLPKERHTRVVLNELDDSAASELVTELAPDLRQNTSLVHAIALKAQGNPFFIEEIVATLADKGFSADDSSGGPAAHGAFEVSVPDTVWGLLAERIDRLPRDEKQVIQGAAIIGRIFWQELVRELTQQEPGPALSLLNQRDFVAPIGPAAFAGDWEWCFRHVLVQEVAYGGLLRETRRAGHIAAAAWLERRSGDRRNEYATLLAHHYRLGEDWTNAAALSELAGDRAAALFAHREARVSYVYALQALGQQEPDLETLRLQIDVALKLARVAFFSPTEEVLHALETARTFAEEIKDEPRRMQVIAALAAWLYMTGKTGPSFELATQAIAGATQAGLEELLVVPYHIAGRVLHAMGDYEQAVKMLEKSIALEEPYLQKFGELSAQFRSQASCSFLGMAYQLLGRVEEGHALCLSALRTAEQNRDRGRIASSHLYVGTPASLMGRLSEAEEHLPQALAMAEETGDLSVVYVSLGFLGHCHGQRNEVDRAMKCLDRALGIAADLNSGLFVSMLQAFRAELDIKAGKVTEAVKRAANAVEIGTQTRQLECEAIAHRVLGWAHSYAGSLSEADAERELRAALAIYRRINGRVMLARTLYELAVLLRHVGNGAGASEAEAEAASLARELRLDWLPMPPPAPLSISVPG